MTGMYKISAAPLLYPKGEFKGKLDGVTFTASSPIDSRQWFANNCGQFELAFSRIMPGSLARAIVAALMRGDEVELPGIYDEVHFERGFLFEWSPIHFVLPPPLRPRQYSC